MCERLYIAAMLVTHLWPHTVKLVHWPLITVDGCAVTFGTAMRGPVQAVLM